MLIRLSSLVLAVAAFVDVSGEDATGDQTAWQDWPSGGGSWGGTGDPWAPPYGGGGGDPAPAPKPEKPDIDPPINKDCMCKKYLKDKAWDYLHKFGIKMENFCCLVGAVSYCLDGGGHGSGGYGSGGGRYVDGEGVTEEDFTYPAPPSYPKPQHPTYDQYGYDHVDPNLYHCIDEAGIGKLAHYYPDTYSSGGSTYAASGAKGTYAKNENQATKPLKPEESLGYGYNPRPPCSWTYNYADYIKCIFTLYFDQAKQACYCYYRTKVHCVCDDCDKDVVLDRDVAYGNAELVCNQCPDGAVDKPGDGYGGNSRPYGSYKPPVKGGYDVYVRGGPYDPCAGYCMLISGFEKHGHSGGYGGGDVYLPGGGY